MNNGLVRVGRFVKKEGKRTGPVGSMAADLAPPAAGRGPGLW